MRIGQGPFAGLAATSDDARMIHIARAALKEHERSGDTITVLGRFPGIYLLSDAPVRALVPYAFTPFAQPPARQEAHDYYARPEHRPALVLAYKDPQLPFINPFDPDFDAWYELRERYPTPLGNLEVFRRRDEAR